MSEQGPPAPLDARSLTIATVLALVVAALALAVYILPANYGLDPIGTGQALGLEGDPPDTGSDETPPALEADTSAQAPQLSRYQTTWPRAEEAGPGTGGYTAENETTTVELPMPPANLTQVRLELTWTDDNETAGQTTEPDELELVLEAPDGTRTDPVRAENGPDGQGSLATTFTVQPAPENRTLLAPDQAEARAHPLAEASDATPQGPWTAHVTVREAGDVQGEVASPGASPGEDEGTDWQLDSQVTTYRLSLSEEGPADVREDTQTFELAPGEGMEHKVTLEANTTLAYAWATTGEVYFDFHGEKAEADGFTSHGTGTASSANGTFTAPFAGTHGWYWENRGEEPVRIELTTRGDYETGFTT